MRLLGSKRPRAIRRATSGAKERRGMTLIDVTVSMVLLAGVALGMGAFVSQHSRTARAGSTRTVAVELASERLEEVRRATRYDSLETKYGVTEPGVAGHAGYRRATTIRRVGGGTSDPMDYKLITVTVTPPNGGRAVKKTTALSAF
jgi:Tfp pilus assembly protein PilV